ncbi:MAG: hypothetical protein MJ170_02190 [Alphaproteobacteria bacterium]|nr:hypothetical protein [Alphaproteobacteria bacterium]
MVNKKQQTSVNMMIQRCHKWRQKRKQYIDQARQTSDEVERERLLQTAEHYGRIVNVEQAKIDSSRDPKEKIPTPEEIAMECPETPTVAESGESTESNEEEDLGFPDFIANLK